MTFATHIHTENHSYTNIDTNLEIVHYIPKGQKLNTTEQYEIYKHHTRQPNNILNDQLQYKSHTLLDTIIPVSYTHLDVYKRQLLHVELVYLVLDSEVLISGVCPTTHPFLFINTILCFHALNKNKNLHIIQKLYKPNFLTTFIIIHYLTYYVT